MESKPRVNGQKEEDALLRRLRVFMAVVDHQGVSEAARALNVSQPAVSIQIRRLEADLGVSLFRRSGRRLSVTDLGAEIARTLRRGLGELDAALNAVRDMSRTQKASIRFGFSAPQLALKAADTFRRSDPHTKLEFRTANSSDLFEALDNYSLDVIMVGMASGKRPYHCQFYESQHIAVLAPPDHALARRTSIDITELADHPVVLREPGSYTRALTERAFSDLGVKPNIAFEVSTREAVTEAVRLGFGLGPVLDKEVPSAHDLAVIPVAGGTITANEYLVCHASSTKYGSVHRFLSVNRQRMPGAT